MQYVTKEKMDKTWCWMYMGLLMLTELEIWIIEDLKVGMCLSYFEELLVE